MRGKLPEITLPFEQAEKAMASTNQMIMIADPEGKWTGRSFNKADVVMTERNHEEERYWEMKNTPKLDVPSSMPPEKDFNIDDYKPDFLKSPNE